MLLRFSFFSNWIYNIPILYIQGFFRSFYFAIDMFSAHFVSIPVHSSSSFSLCSLVLFYFSSVSWRIVFFLFFHFKFLWIGCYTIYTIFFSSSVLLLLQFLISYIGGMNAQHGKIYTAVRKFQESNRFLCKLPFWWLNFNIFLSNRPKWNFEDWLCTL